MNILKLSQRVFLAIGFMMMFMVVIPSFWRVEAAITLPLDAESINRNPNIKPSPSQNSILNFVDPTINQALYGCPISTISGSLADTINVGQILLNGYTYQEYLCAKYKGTPLSRTEGLNTFVNKGTAALFYIKPYSGVDYLDEQVYALANLGTVDAQNKSRFYYPGLGFNLQAPMQAFWGWSVNVVYGFLVVFIVIVAIAITFRSKLGGSTVVTLQNSIPNIALAMILVPLSFAITGLFIDFITLGTNVVHGFLLAPGAPAHGVFEALDDDGRGYHVDDSSFVFLRIRNGVGSALDFSEATENALDLVLGPDKSSIEQVIDGILSVITGILDATGVYNDGSSNVRAWIGSIINFLLQVIVFLTGLRIFYILLKKYISILFAPIFSPFIFGSVALPGVGLKNVMQYLKGMASVSIFFIVTYTMTLLSVILVDENFLKSLPGNVASNFYIPPMLGVGGVFRVDEIANSNGINPLLSLIMGITSFVLYLSIPKTLKDIDAKLGTNRSPIIPIIGDTFSSVRDSLGLGLFGAGLASSFGLGSYNALRGVEAGEPNSAQYAWKRFVNQRVARLQAVVDDPTRRGIRGGFSKNAARAARFAVRRTGQVTGVNVPQTNEKGERTDGVITAEWKMMKGFYFTVDSAAKTVYLRPDLMGSITNFPVKIPLTLALKASGITMPEILNQRTVTVLQAEFGGPAGLVPSSTKLPFRAGTDWFNISSKSQNQVRLELDGDSFISQNGLTEAEIKFNLLLELEAVAYPQNVFINLQPISGDKIFLKISMKNIGPIGINISLSDDTDSKWFG